jgi:hypothetical protein
MDEAPAADVAALLARYLISLDDDDLGGLDDRWAGELFTPGARVEFPMSRHVGAEGMAEYHRASLDVFERTQHLHSPPVVAVDGSRARLRANLVSTHVHRRPPAGAGPLFTAGTGVFGEAELTAQGWRLSALEFRVIWTDGKPPSAA